MSILISRIINAPKQPIIKAFQERRRVFDDTKSVAIWASRISGDSITWNNQMSSRQEEQAKWYFCENEIHFQL